MSIAIQFPAINEGIKLPMRWYKSAKRRNSLRRVCKGQCQYKLYSPGMEMIPFQVYAEFAGPFTIDWKVYDANGVLVGSPDVTLLHEVTILPDRTYWYYLADFFTFIMPRGFYTSEITIGNGVDSVTWYSEEFYSIGSCDNEQTFCDYIDLCSSDCWSTSIGDDGFDWINLHPIPITQPCTIRKNTLGIISTLTLLNVFPVNLELYHFSFSIEGTTPGEYLDFDFGGGTTIHWEAEDGAFDFFGYSALDVDMVITASADFTGAFTSINTFSQNLPSIFKCHKTLIWWNDCGLVGEIYYGDSIFKSHLWLENDCEIINATTKYYTEGVENGEKDFTPTFQKRSTVYTMELGLQPPHVIEALGEMVLHKFVEIIVEDTDGITKSVIKQGTATIKADYSESGACLAPVTMTFELDDTTVTDGCCDEEIAEGCVESDLVPGFESDLVSVLSCNPSVGINGAEWVFDFGSNSYCPEPGAGDITFTFDCLNPLYFYKLTVNIGAVGTGGLLLDVNGSSLDGYDTGDSNSSTTYTLHDLTSTSVLTFSPIFGWDGCVGISIEQYVPTWQAGTGWSYDPDNNKFCYAATTEILEVTGGGGDGIVSGTEYRVTVDVTVDFGSIGGVTLHIGGHTEYFSSSEVRTFDFTATVDGECYFETDGTNSFGCINSLSVCELGVIE